MTEQLNGNGAVEYMRMQRQGHAFQGMAAHGDLLFQLFDTGICAVFDLVSRSPEPLCVFPLGSHNEGVPDKNYKNHSNQCMFSDFYLNGNPLPLLYVTSGAGTERDENGFYYRCSVEDVHLQTDASGRVRGGSSATVQTVSYRPEGTLPDGCEQPCWGCPAWFPDLENGYLYIFSARYRTTKEYLHLYDKNSYILTKFRLPDPESGRLVALDARDILDQTLFPYDVIFTQGGMLRGGKIFYTFGAGHDPYPDGMRVYDAVRGEVVAAADFSGSCFAGEEIESVTAWRGGLYVNTNSKPCGGLFALGGEFDFLLKS